MPLTLVGWFFGQKRSPKYSKLTAWKLAVGDGEGPLVTNYVPEIGGAIKRPPLLMERQMLILFTRTSEEERVYHFRALSTSSNP